MQERVILFSPIYYALKETRIASASSYQRFFFQPMGFSKNLYSEDTSHPLEWGEGERRAHQTEWMDYHLSLYVCVVTDSPYLFLQKSFEPGNTSSFSYPVFPGPHGSTHTSTAIQAHACLHKYNCVCAHTSQHLHGVPQLSWTNRSETSEEPRV